MTGERVLKDHWRERFGDEEDDLEENLEDPEECGEDKANAIMGAIHNKLNNDWFNNTSEDEFNLEGILDYLEPRSYDGFIDLDEEAYNRRRRNLHKGSRYKEVEFEGNVGSQRKYNHSISNEIVRLISACCRMSSSKLIICFTAFVAIAFAAADEDLSPLAFKDLHQQN
ncbi:hypothetical protein Tco_1499771 [Tanacetum coccineum]